MIQINPHEHHTPHGGGRGSLPQRRGDTAPQSPTPRPATDGREAGGSTFQDAGVAGVSDYAVVVGGVCVLVMVFAIFGLGAWKLVAWLLSLGGAL